MSNRKETSHEYGRARRQEAQSTQIAAALRENYAHLVAPITRTSGDLIKGPYNGEGSDWHKPVLIRNQYGLHARPAAMFSKISMGYDCDVSVCLEGNPERRVSGKSILGLITLEASQGKTLVIGARGTKSSDCVQELVGLVERGFDED